MSSPIAVLYLLCAYRAFAAPIQPGSLGHEHNVVPENVEAILTNLRDNIRDQRLMADSKIEILDSAVRDKGVLTQEQMNALDSQIRAWGVDPQDAADKILAEVKSNSQLTQLRIALDGVNDEAILSIWEDWKKELGAEGAATVADAVVRAAGGTDGSMDDLDCFTL